MNAVQNTEHQGGVNVKASMKHITLTIIAYTAAVHVKFTYKC